MFRARSSRKGFTLVELLVVTPVALLVIVGFIALMVVMVGDVIASRTFNTMTYDIQNALDTIERDVRLSTEFQTTSGELPAPQGKNGNTSPFTSTAGDLVLGTIATDKNPLDPTRRFVHYNAPFECSSEHRYKNRVFFTSVIYFVRDNSLWRRSYVPSYTPSNMCSTPWQINTCSPDYTSAQTQCQSTDSEILKDVKSFRVAYHERPEDTVEISSASASDASTIKVSIELEGRAAGRTVGAASSTRATKLSSRDVNLAPPDAPVVSGSRSGTDAVFSWPGVPTASSYIIRYNINGGGWRTASENSTETSLSVPAHHGDTVSIEVMARNTTGTSPRATATAEIPTWIGCSYMNEWKTIYATRECGFTKTRSGVVLIRGLPNGGLRNTHVSLFQLPPDYRPRYTQMFEGVANNYVSVRIQVDANGWVRLIEGSSSDPGNTAPGWLSISNIMFLASDASSSATNLTLQNSWKNYHQIYGGSGVWPDLTSAQDASGRIHLSGLVGGGTYTPSHTAIAPLSTPQRPSDYLIIPARAANGFNQVGITEPSRGSVVARGFNPSSWISIQAMYYPSSYSGWTNFTTTSGTPGNGQIGNGWVAYGDVHATPAYTKSDDGIVTIKGLIRNGSTTSGTVVAQLPPGYRPGDNQTIRTVGVAYDNVNAVFDIHPDGRVVALKSNVAWTSLSSISFLAGP